MTPDAQELFEKALTLSDEQRAELASGLIASLDTTIETDVDAAWQHEIARRYQEVQSGQVKTVSWAEVERHGRALLDGE